MDTKTAFSLSTLKYLLPDLASEANERAEEFEALRNIAPDFTQKLVSAGAHRILVSKAQGGLGGCLMDWYEVMTTLAEADASTGWTCSHGAITSALIANIADQEFAKTFFDDPNSNAAWSNLPRIKSREVKGGLRINGSWGFASGCTAATYVGGMLPLGGDTDTINKRFVVALVPSVEASIDETWDPIGLAGSGSHDIVFDDVFVPWQRIFDWPIVKPTYTFPTQIFASTWFISLCAAATHLGLARRAIDEARRELTGKQDRYTGEPVLAKPENLIPLEESEGLLFALRSGFEKALESAWEYALRGDPSDSDLTIKMNLACATAVHQGAAIVRTVYDVSGASAVRKSGALQRLLRDASCLTHHISVNRQRILETGNLRFGFERT